MVTIKHAANMCKQEESIDSGCDGEKAGMVTGALTLLGRLKKQSFLLNALSPFVVHPPETIPKFRACTCGPGATPDPMI